MSAMDVIEERDQAAAAALVELRRVTGKLRWSVENDAWTPVKPIEAKLLLAWLDVKDEALKRARGYIERSANQGMPSPTVDGTKNVVQVITDALD